MIYQRLVSIFGATLLAFCSQAAVAASVSLNPEFSVVNPNQTFSVDLFLDAADVDGLRPGNFSGQVTVVYDPNLLTLVDTSSSLTTPVTARGTTAGNMTFGFGNLVFPNSADEGVVGNFNFQSTGALGVAEIALIAVDDGFSLTSFANNAGGELNEFMPVFTGTSVTVNAVPLPAAAWLMLSALGALGLIKRKSSAVQQRA